MNVRVEGAKLTRGFAAMNVRYPCFRGRGAAYQDRPNCGPSGRLKRANVFRWALAARDWISVQNHCCRPEVRGLHDCEHVIRTLPAPATILAAKAEAYPRRKPSPRSSRRWPAFSMTALSIDTEIVTAPARSSSA